MPVLIKLEGRANRRPQPSIFIRPKPDFALGPTGRPRRIDHPGYGPFDAFYRATGKASALRTCNSWVAGKLRLAGVETSVWPPFVQGLVWRYRALDQDSRSY